MAGYGKEEWEWKTKGKGKKWKSRSGREGGKEMREKR